MVFVYITCKNKKEARTISRHLLKRKLIACANFFPIETIYTWKGKIEETKEIVLLVKTLKKHYTLIKKEVAKIHSYEIPCVSLIETKENKKFLDWIKTVV